MLYEIDYIDTKTFNTLLDLNEIKKYPYKEWIYVSKNGKLIINIISKIILKQNTYRNGYKYVKIYDYNKKKSKSYLVHRLVAETWLDNPDKLSDVDHIDFNRSNNHYTNLRWLSHKDNCKRRSDIIKDNYNHKYGVAILNNDNSVVMLFKSIKEGAEFVGGKENSLRQKLLGNYANGIYKNTKWKLVNLADYPKIEKDVVGFKDLEKIIEQQQKKITLTEQIMQLSDGVEKNRWSCKLQKEIELMSQLKAQGKEVLKCFTNIT